MHPFHLRALPLASLVAVVVLLLHVAVASAHEHREVGDYEITVGFRVEPALVDEPNGLDLRVTTIPPSEGEEGTPIEGLNDTLQAEIIHGEETMPLELRPRFGQPGAYTADVIPVATGTYSFHIWGNIEGTEIDETFTSGPETFSDVEPKDEITFPADAAGTESSSGDGDEGSDTLAIAGIVLGSLGLLAGIAGVVMAMNARNAQPRRTTVAGEVGD